MNKSSCGSPRSVILVAAISLIGFLMFGTARLSGQLFVACRDRFNTGRKEASLPFVLSFTVRNLSGPIVGYLGNKFGLQSVTLSGCLLAAVAVGGCFFVEDIIPFTVLWGGCFGFGFGMGTNLLPNILHVYFKKSFNRMYGIILAGGCMGSIVLPGVIDVLLKNYGTSGTLLIISALVLHCVPAALLLRKSERSRIVKRISEIDEINETPQEVKIEETISFENSSTLNDKYRDGTKINDISSSQSSLHHTEQLDTVKPVELKNGLTGEEINKLEISQINYTESQNRPLTVLFGGKVVEQLDDAVVIEFNFSPTNVLNKTTNFNDIQETETCTQVAGHLDGAKLNQSTLSQTNTSNQTTSTSESKEKYLGTKKHVDLTDEEAQKKHVLKQSTSISQNFKIFLDPAYILILLSLGFSLVVMTTMYTVVLDVCRDKGVMADVTVLMTFAFTDMLGRFSFGYIADGGCISELNLYVLCLGSSGILMIGFTWLNGFYAVLIFVAGFGTMLGGILVLTVGMIANYMKKDSLTMAFSSKYFLFGLLSFSESPVIGYFRETLKSYDGLLYLLGSMCFLGTIITLLIPSAARWRDNRNEPKNKEILM